MNDRSYEDYYVYEDYWDSGNREDYIEIEGEVYDTPKKQISFSNLFENSKRKWILIANAIAILIFFFLIARENIRLVYGLAALSGVGRFVMYMFAAVLLIISFAVLLIAYIIQNRK